MLLIIHNLPKEVTSLDVRHLIQEQCGLREVILDNLLDEGPGKRITVGLPEEEDALILMRKLNGLHYKTCQLYVEDVRKKKLSAPSYPVLIPAGLQPQAPKPWYIENVPKNPPTLQVNYSNMPYYMTQDSLLLDIKGTFIDHFKWSLSCMLIRINVYYFVCLVMLCS